MPTNVNNQGFLKCTTISDAINIMYNYIGCYKYTSDFYSITSLYVCVGQGYVVSRVALLCVKKRKKKYQIHRVIISAYN